MPPLSVLTHTFMGYHQVSSTQKHAPPSTRVTAVPSPASSTQRCCGCGGGRDPVARKQRAGASVFSVRGARGIPVLPPVPLRQGKQPRPGPVCLPWPRPQCECSCSAAGRCGTFAPEPGSPRRQHPDATPEHPHRSPSAAGGTRRAAGHRLCIDSPCAVRCDRRARAPSGCLWKIPVSSSAWARQSRSPGAAPCARRWEPDGGASLSPGALLPSRRHTERCRRHGRAVLCPKNTRTAHTAPPRGSP